MSSNPPTAFPAATLPVDLMDLLMRESALALAREKIKEARSAAVFEKGHLEENPQLLHNFTPEAKQGREPSIKTAHNNLAYYDHQMKKVESLATLIEKDICRWLECCLKTSSSKYAAALATHDYPEDWSRFGYGYELLVKSFQVGLQNLMVVFTCENKNGERSRVLMDSIHNLLPIARQIEIDVEFLNRIIVQQNRQKRVAGEKVTLYPEYSWCETVEQLGTATSEEGLETLHELISACTGFLSNLGQIIRRGQFLAEAKKAQMGRTFVSGSSFLQTWHEGLKTAAMQRVDESKLGEIIAETESLLMDGRFTERFNLHMALPTANASPAPALKTEKQATSASFIQNDVELRALKAKLQAELEEVAKVKAALAARERTLKENEQKLKDQEQLFAEKCKREQAAMDEAKAKLLDLEASVSTKDREAEKKRAAQMAELEGKMAELAARSAFMDESELRLLEKGEEQMERLAEIEQREEDLIATKRELNAMRKEMGLPMIALRAKPVDEFEE